MYSLEYCLTYGKPLIHVSVIFIVTVINQFSTKLSHVPLAKLVLPFMFPLHFVDITVVILSRLYCYNLVTCLSLS